MAGTGPARERSGPSLGGVRSARLLAGLMAALPDGLDVVVVRDGPATVVAAGPSTTLRADGAAALAALDDLDRAGGWWAGVLRYDLGRACEPYPARLAPDDDAADADAGFPDLALARFDARLVLGPDGDAALVGTGPGRDVLADAWARARRTPVPSVGATAAPGGLEWTSSLDRAAHRDAVARIHDHLDRGDCYQVNLTRRLWTPHALDARALAAAVWERHPAPHAALVECDGRAVVSASPERFLRREGDRVESRPIKGTGPVADSLARSGKDRAENVMIVDLVRNDLGRVCRYGSVRVPELCGVEAHPGLHHLVSTVTGELRPDVSTAALLRATFPAASITGAPKPEVLRIIEDLEPVRRGVYCGAVGWIDADRQRLDLNVAIRTFTIGAAGTAFGVGGGIVADSRADDEWAETELKAARLLALAATVPARQATPA
jgi:para-aminobenzoate synthetase component 1